MTTLMDVRNLSVELGGVRRWLRRSTPPVRAVSDVSLQLHQREPHRNEYDPADEGEQQGIASSPPLDEPHRAAAERQSDP